MPAGCACGVIFYAILIIASIGDWWKGGINAITLTYLCDSKPILFCTCAEYYVESSWNLSKSFFWNSR